MVIETNATDPLVSRKKAAQMLNTTPGTLAVDDCTKRRNLLPQKIKGRIYYPLSVIEAERQRRLSRKRVK